MENSFRNVSSSMPSRERENRIEVASLCIVRSGLTWILIIVADLLRIFDQSQTSLPKTHPGISGEHRLMPNVCLGDTGRLYKVVFRSKLPASDTNDADHNRE